MAHEGQQAAVLFDDTGAIATHHHTALPGGEHPLANRWNHQKSRYHRENRQHESPSQTSPAGLGCMMHGTPPAWRSGIGCQQHQHELEGQELEGIGEKGEDKQAEEHKPKGRTALAQSVEHVQHKHEGDEKSRHSLLHRHTHAVGQRIGERIGMGSQRQGHMGMKRSRLLAIGMEEGAYAAAEERTLRHCRR